MSPTLLIGGNRKKAEIAQREPSISGGKTGYKKSAPNAHHYTPPDGTCGRVSRRKIQASIERVRDMPRLELAMPEKSGV
jgi:hypothetical protein